MFTELLSRTFKREPVVDEGTQAWILDTFLWALENLDSEFFVNQSKLVLPTNEYYPGEVSSVEQMAQRMFAATVDYAGLNQWPVALLPLNAPAPNSLPSLTFEQGFRGSEAKLITSSDDVFPMQYHPQQVNQPQDLIASISQFLSAVVINNQAVRPPGGNDTVPQTIDLVGVFLGFGVILSNTAYQFKGGCGSCNNRQLNRQVALPETETIYALALFCYLKNYPTKHVTSQLKKHLGKVYKNSYKEITSLFHVSDSPTVKALKAFQQ